MTITDQNRAALLERSKFRSRFKLDAKESVYFEKAGIEKIRVHAIDFVRQRLAPARPRNDGKQTPFKGHPVFKAQHATATCCRGCLEKWYAIPKGRVLTSGEIEKIVGAIMDWIRGKTGPQGGRGLVDGLFEA